MTTPSNHNREIVSQFTKQAIPFTRLSGHVDALETLVEMSKANNESRVLDVASGPGLVAAALAKAARYVECVDLTPAMLEQAIRHATAEGLANIAFREGDAMQLPYPDSSFDIVVTRYSFHHFLEPENVLGEMIRVCVPGGRVLVADVGIDATCSEQFNYIEKLRDSSHVRALTVAELGAMFVRDDLVDSEQAGYVVDVGLEKQLAVSFPKEEDAMKIRKLITEDVGINNTGTNPRVENGEVFYSYPISIFAANKIA